MTKRYKREITAGIAGLLIILFSILSISIDMPFIGRVFSFIIIFPMAMAYEESDATRVLIITPHQSHSQRTLMLRTQVKMFK